MTKYESLRAELFAIVVNYGRGTSHGTDETFVAVDNIISRVKLFVKSQRNGNFSQTQEVKSYNFAIDGLLVHLGDKSESASDATPV